MAEAGVRILTIVDEGVEPEVVCFLPGTDRPRIHEGQEIQVAVAGYTKTPEYVTITSVGSEVISGTVAAQLLGIHDFLAMLPELSARRAWLQARRRRSDAEILARFGGCWMEAVPSPHGQLHIALRERLLAALPLPQVTA